MVTLLKFLKLIQKQLKMSLRNMLPSCDIVTTGTLLVCLVAFYAAYITIRRSTSRLPPGPVGLPFIGNLLIFWWSNIRKEHPHDLMSRLAARYGKVRLNMPPIEFSDLLGSVDGSDSQRRH